MRLFGWVQNKLGGKQDNKRTNTTTKKQETREEFSDWPQGLLSIGTFGNDDIKEIAKNQVEENPSPSRDEEILDITPEEVGKLQKELTKLLSRNKLNKDKGIADLPLDRFLNCPSSLEVDRRISNALWSDSDYFRDEDIDKTISAIIGKCREAISVERNRSNKSVGMKSFSFLLKKMFVCRSGFAPVPSLRDTLQESRMEKLLRTMLHKKLSPQNSYRGSSAKKYLDKTTLKKEEDKDNRDRQTPEKTAGDGCKWDKTDSEYSKSTMALSQLYSQSTRG